MENVLNLQKMKSKTPINPAMSGISCNSSSCAGSCETRP